MDWELGKPLQGGYAYGHWASPYAPEGGLRLQGGYAYGHWASPYAPEGGLRLRGGYAYRKNCSTIQKYLDGLLDRKL